MSDVQQHTWIIQHDDPILVTGATGFIGERVVRNLLERGFRRIRCLARTRVKAQRLQSLLAGLGHAQHVDVVMGNLLSPSDCASVTKDVKVILHLAAGRGEKLVPDAFLNSVVTTRNLLDAVLAHGCMRRFVNVSSFAVYTNAQRSMLLDETAPIEQTPALRGDAYCFAKVKQEQLVREYGAKHGVPFVIVRPGYVYGPGNEGITGRVGISTFGVFLHLGGSNPIPLSFVDNCAEVIALAGLSPGVDGEVFNAVDDDLPSSRSFLRQFKRNVKPFRSVYLPHFLSYLLCYGWEKYAEWSEGQLPPVFNRRDWRAAWRKTSYTNEKIKIMLHWSQKVPTPEGLRAHFKACRERGQHA